MATLTNFARSVFQAAPLALTATLTLLCCGCNRGGDPGPEQLAQSEELAETEPQPGSATSAPEPEDLDEEVARSVGETAESVPGLPDRGAVLDEDPPRRHAVLVGVNDEGPSGIQFCVNDMRELRDVLVGQGYEASNVQLLVRDDSSESTEPIKDVVLGALTKMCDDANESDTVLFAFAGHGVESDSGCFLMPCGVDPDDLEGTAIPMREVQRILGSCRAKYKFLIVDACHSGGGEGGINQENLLAPGSDIFGLFSCRARQVSYEDPSLQHGVFSYYLIRALRGEADVATDGAGVDQQVTIDEAYDYVHKMVDNHQFNGDDIEQEPFRRIEGSGDPVLSVYERRPDVEMLTLPGLTGQWWFKETPWLLPDIRYRLALAHSQTANRPLPDGSTVMADDLRSSAVDQLQSQLWSEFDVIRRELDQDRKIVVGLIGEWKDISPDETKERVLSLLQQDTSFYSLYSLAVVQHYLGMPEAGESFESAIAKRNDDGDLPKGLQARLLADYAQFLLETDQLVEAKLRFEEAMGLVTQNDAPLFWIECELGRANSLRRLTRYDDSKASLDAALSVAKAHVPEDHPLVAYIHKSIGWLYMDEWRLDEARESFLQSNSVVQSRGDGFEGLPVQDQVFILHNRHGLAMVDRYSGNRLDAENQYLQLIDDIQLARDAAVGTSGVTVLTERLVNSQERLADTYLFVPSVSNVAGAQSVLADALNEARNLTGSSSVITRARLQCKLALAFALEGRSDEARECLEEFEELAATLSEVSQERLELYRRAAEGLALLAGESTLSEGTNELAQLLEEAQEDKVRELYSRDDFDVLLLIGTRLVQANAGQSWLAGLGSQAEGVIGIIPFVGETAQSGADAVIGTGLDFIDSPQDRADMLFEHVRGLFYALPNEYRNQGAGESGGEGVDLYLRGFYDASLVAALQYSLQEECQIPTDARGLLAIAKTGSSTLRFTYEDNRQESLRPGAPALICYVPSGADAGWAILFPNCTVFALDPWMESGSSLPEDLQAAIGDLPGLQIHWSDKIHGWTEEDLPFDVPSAQPAN